MYKPDKKIKLICLKCKREFWGYIGKVCPKCIKENKEGKE